jgi:Tripartite tricarboxylate transporter TctB family
MITRRQLEIVTGALTGAFAIAVIISSVEVGSGWSSAGVQSGTFPLLAGILILGGSLVNIARAFVDPPALALHGAELRRVGLLFLPALAFVAAIPLVGLYVASACYLLWTLSVQHRMPYWRSGLIVLATMATLYGLFERTFEVVLPHGWLGTALGF